MSKGPGREAWWSSPVLALVLMGELVYDGVIWLRDRIRNL